jgi:hypothetical protein
MEADILPAEKWVFFMNIPINREITGHPLDCIYFALLLQDMQQYVTDNMA